MNTMQTYTGADATLEILIMLLGAFLLGALLMWLYNTYLFECVDEDEEGEVVYEVEKLDDDKEEEKMEVVNLSTIKQDDLKIIEGIGPKIESILKSAGIETLEDLANSTPDQIRDILREKGGERYAFHDPTTWPDQAKLASEGREEELREYQEFLNGGRV